MSKLITPPQLFKLSGFAREAWVYQGKPGYIKGKTTAADAFDSFRKTELFSVTEASNGAVSWKEVLNADFEAIAGHFLSLAGKDGEAFTARHREVTKKSRQMLARIEIMLSEAALATGGSPKWNMNYARTISRAQYGAEPDALNEIQLRQLLITVSQRTRAAIKAAMPGSEEEARSRAADLEAETVKPETIEV